MGVLHRGHISLIKKSLAENNKRVIELHEVLDSYFSEHISLIIHLDASIESCLSRINKREVSDKFEEKGKDFLVKIKSSYDKIFLNNKKSVKVLTDGSISDVQKNIQKYLIQNQKYHLQN